jgi:hypothetical protein
MKRPFLISTVLTLCIPLASIAQSKEQPSQAQKHNSAAQMRELMLTANNAQQYQTLADHFRQKESAHRARASEEKVEWARRAENGVGVKYPRPVDSARYLYESYSYDADRYGKLAAHYEQLSNLHRSAEIVSTTR